MQPTKTVRVLRRVRLVLWLVLPVTALGLLGSYLWTHGERLPTATDSARALISGKFSLVDHNGQAVTDLDYTGSWRLMFFGYTHCPDACPTTLNTMAEIMDKLGGDGQKVRPIFVSIDPERDSPAVLKEYVSAFHGSLIGLTGSAVQIKDAAEAFLIYYGKAGDAGDATDYLMDHSAMVFLMDTNGRFATVYSHGTDIEKIVADIRQRL